MKIVQISYNKGGSSQEFVTRPGVKLNNINFFVASHSVEDDAPEDDPEALYQLFRKIYPESLNYNKVYIPNSDTYGACGLFLEQFFLVTPPPVVIGLSITNLSYMFAYCYRLVSAPTLAWEDGLIPNDLNLAGMYCLASNLGVVCEYDAYAALMLQSFSIAVGLTDITAALPLIYHAQNCMYMFAEQKLISCGDVTFGNPGTVDATLMFYKSQLSTFGAIIIDDDTVVISNEMFLECQALTSVGNVDFSKLIDYQYMFKGCTALTHIDVTGFIDKDLNMSSCANLDDATLLAICYATAQSVGTLTFNTALSAKAENHVKFGDGTLVFCESTDPESQGTLASFMTLKGWTLAFE